MTARQPGRRVGVEEELLLVDPESGVPRSVSSTALRAFRFDERGWTRAEASDSADDAGDDEPSVEQELFLQQIETANVPCLDLASLGDEVRRGRRAAVEAGAAAGARVAALASPVIAGDAAVTPKGRYEQMVARYGSITHEQMVCGMHVHVEVDDDEEAVGVLDRVRPWLPVLLAVSSNSPYWDRADTGYASYRSQVWSRWPSAGPTEAFGSARAYHTAVQELIASQAALDEGMVYFDVRLARSFPTLELRVADVCAEVSDVVLVSALARGLVATAAAEWRDGAPVPVWRSELLRGATWLAARHGLSGDLLDPVSRQLRPAYDVLRVLVGQVSDALRAAGDEDAVDAAVARLRRHGTGAERQRAVYAHRRSFEAVVADAVDRTAHPE